MPAVSTPANADKIASHIMLLKINGVPPRVSVVIYRDFNVICFSFNSKVAVRDILGFSAKLQKYTELDAIILRLNNSKVDLKAEVSNFVKFLIEICDTVDNTEKLVKIRFLCEQLKLTLSKKHGERYTGYIMKESMNLFLKSRNAYNSLRELLILPHKNHNHGLFRKIRDNYKHSRL